MIKLFLSIVFLFIAALSVIGQNCSINAGVNSSVCLGETVQLDGSVGGPIDDATLQWSIVSQPSGSNAAIENPGSLLTNVKDVTVAGTYTFRLRTVCGDGVATQDDVTVTVNAVPAQPAITGPSTVACYDGSPIDLTGTAPGSGETVSWSVSSGVGGTFGSPASNQTTFTPRFLDNECASSTPVTVRYTIRSANGCTSSVTRTINFQRNYGLSATARPQQVCGTSTQLMGSCPGTGTVSWTQVSGPNTANIGSPSARTTAATDLAEGDYVFRYTVTGGCSPGSVDVNVSVAGSAVTQAEAGADQHYCQVPGEISLTGNKPAVGETVTWSQVSGGTSVTFSDSDNFNTTASGLTDDGAPYTFQYRVSNDVCFSVDTVKVFKRPVLTLTEGGGALCGPSGSSASTSSNRRINSSTYAYHQLDTLKIDVTLLSGPAGAEATFWKHLANGAGSGNRVGIAIGETISRTRSGLDLYHTDNPSQFYYQGVGFAFGPAVGVYKFRVRMATECGAAEREVTYTRGLTGAGINAGTDVALPCNATSATLAGNLADGLGLWSTVKMPAGATNPFNPGNQTLRNPPISSLIPGTYVFRLNNNMGPTCQATEFDEVKLVIANNPPSTPNAGADVTTCAGSYQLNGSPVPPDAFAEWTVVSPASSGVVFSDPSVSNPVANGLQPNTTYTFRYTLTNGCGSSFDEVTITTDDVAGPESPAISSTRINQCGTMSAALPGNVNIPVSHPALREGITATWQVITNPEGAGFTTSVVNDTTTQVTLQNLTQSTAFSIVYTLSSEDCPGVVVSDTLTGYIRRTSDPSFLNAGPAQQLCSVTTFPATAALNGSASTGPVWWSQLYSSNGQTATIDSPETPSTSVTIPAEGVYRFKYEIQSTSQECEGRLGQSVTEILVSSPGRAAMAGEDITFCDNDGVTSLNANAVATGRWDVYQVLTGSAPVLGDATSPTSSLTFNGSGESILRWSSYGSNPECGPSSSDLVKVRYTAPANAGSDQSLCDVTSVRLAAASPAPATGLWSQVSGPAANIADPTDPKTLVTGLTGGTYTFRFSVDGGPGCTTTDDVIISVTNNTEEANAGADMATCSGGTNKVPLDATPPSEGTTGTWSVVSVPDGAQPGTFTDVHDPKAIYDGVTEPGKYVLAWTLGDGACTSTDYVELTAGDEPCALPVTLVGFTAREAEGVTMLRWTTSAETNFSHFEVEYADKSLRFRQIGKLPANGSFPEYRHSFRQPDGIGYYRLRMVDLDASYNYSQIITVVLGNPEIVLFSNPAGGRLRIKGLKGNEILGIYDKTGRLLITRKNSDQENEVSLEGLTPGTYFLEVVRPYGQPFRKIFIKE